MLIPPGGRTFSVGVDVRVDGVQAPSGQSGFAYASIYQLDANGRLLGFRDFVQATGTRAWRRYTWTFTALRRTAWVSLRCGIYRAPHGTATFDNWTMVRGVHPRTMAQVRQRGPRPHRGGRAAVLDAGTMPVRGAASDAHAIAAILQYAGIATQIISTDQLCDPAVLDADRLDFVVLPTGESFPVAARLALINFLRDGGGMITTGGYALNNLLCRHKGHWVCQSDLADARRAEALRADHSLLGDGGFEADGPAPAGRSRPAADGWHRSGPACTVVTQTPHQGRRCACVALGDDTGRGARFWQDVAVQPGSTYDLAGWMRTDGVSGRGYAFMALYQYTEDGRLVRSRDIAQASGTTPWRRHAWQFTLAPGAARVRVIVGLYLAGGKAWFDDLRLNDVTDARSIVMNTSTGEVGDGLTVPPDRIGIFDPSLPLRRVRSLVASPAQCVIGPVHIDGEMTGYVAAGVLGHHEARWVPLLEALDRYGRPRGAAAAMTLHYAGYYAGSCWAYFGVDNRDLFVHTDTPMARALQGVGRFLVRRTFLHDFHTDRALYKPGETARASVVVDNRGLADRHVTVRFAVQAAGGPPGRAETQQDLTVPAGTSRRVDADLPAPPHPAELVRVTATLLLNGQPIDRMDTGYATASPAALAAGPPLRFEHNYFTLGGRAMFLFGSDDYDEAYRGNGASPLAWATLHRAARDIGVNLYENLQYASPGYAPTGDDWRAWQAMAQSTQRHGLVFMPGMLIGQNVAVGDDLLARQSHLCAQYARHFARCRSLLYYLNGDYVLRTAAHHADIRALWNRWLRSKYGSDEAMAAVWPKAARTAPLGQLPYPPPAGAGWGDPVALDKACFLAWLTRRWNQSHTQAVRQCDKVHPVTSEYYQKAYAGIDLRLTVDDLDVSNIGFFDRLGDDIDRLPLALAWSDLRAAGKGVSLGEYGVKTHPAWSVRNGATGYHVRRTLTQQRQLFLAVAHYALGLGACKVQNWCLRDSQAWVFPWGMLQPNEPVCKPVAYVHRNLSMMWRFLTPRYKPAPLVVCVSSAMRLGNEAYLGQMAADRTFAALLALHYGFNVIDDFDLDRLSAGAKAMILPSPFAMSDETFARLLAWVRRGHSLLVTGDLSYDPLRRRTRTDRLTELIGAASAGLNYPNVARFSGHDVQVTFSWPGMTPLMLRPCMKLKVTTARVLGATADHEPVLLSNEVGAGKVYFLSDPIELASGPAAGEARRMLYSAFCRAAGLSSAAVMPDAGWLHVMIQPTARGDAYVVYNTRHGRGGRDVRLDTAAGCVMLHVRDRWPAMAAVTHRGAVVELTACDHAATAKGDLFVGRGMQGLVSLDGKDLRTSRAVLVAPFEIGQVRLAPRAGALEAVCGDFHNGVWRPLERIALDAARPLLDIDADRATCLILVCDPAAERHWSERLTQSMLHPERIEGY